MSLTKMIYFDICFVLTVLTRYLQSLWKIDVLMQISVVLEQPSYISGKMYTYSLDHIRFARYHLLVAAWLNCSFLEEKSCHLPWGWKCKKQWPYQQQSNYGKGPNFHDWWMDKEDVVYICNGMLLSHQKEWTLAICNNVGGARVHYAKRNKSVRKRQIAYDFIIYGI